eukprot:TRINITY_DN417_c0_g1_i1.p2 TRINITY_DN417_c0_g1~~TRINITY_DN417_c0_g1_i1.p2  ORF type:complete len:209 (+),score=60.19 TRINITY_DN417_c0_g1_i1:950-1576(+)
MLTSCFSTKQQPTRLYVGSLHANISEKDIENIFSEFGEVQTVEVHRDTQTGISKGFAFVQYKDPEAAKRALAQVNGRELIGRPIKVGLVNSTTGKPVSGDLDDTENPHMDAQTRVVLMSRFNMSKDETAGPHGHPSQCIVLQNMFDNTEAKEANFEDELAEDVKEECTKYGQIDHIRVDSQNPVCWAIAYTMAIIDGDDNCEIDEDVD